MSADAIASALAGCQHMADRVTGDLVEGSKRIEMTAERQRSISCGVLKLFSTYHRPPVPVSCVRARHTVVRWRCKASRGTNER